MGNTITLLGRGERPAALAAPGGRADSKDHVRYRTRLEDVINGPAAYGASAQILASAVRICSHPGIFAQPSEVGELLECCGILLGQPNATSIQPGDRHWALSGRLCLDGPTKPASPSMARPWRSIGCCHSRFGECSHAARSAARSAAHLHARCRWSGIGAASAFRTDFPVG